MDKGVCAVSAVCASRLAGIAVAVGIDAALAQLETWELLRGRSQ
jgi:hypothetical protein